MSLKIAIYEDNRMFRELLTDLVQCSPGLICTGSFPDANNILQKMNRSLPDVILMDIEMPGMNGIEAVKVIKSHFPNTLVLMQTANEEDDKIFDAICAGASGYLLKNTAPSRILEAIHEANLGGSPMSPSVARKVLERFSTIQKVSTKNEFDLSEREKEILQLLVKGMSYKLIADACFLSIDTVKFHIKNIYEKLQVNSKAEAVAKAFKSGLV
ncbi:MAG: response regulator transcription factor [Bacteroidetes bacterium]|nr:response regulator transcription factor [Bacteroidota bacterium]